MTRILTLSGSLRAASTNTAVLHTLAQLAPEGVVLEHYDYSDVPLYNDDMDRPESVDRLIAAIAAADAVIIATPEYNYSVPGVLKNAIDWASRPAYKSCFFGKKTGVVSAAASIVGGARAQAHLKTILLGMGSPVFAYPEVLVPQSFNKVEDGRVTDERSRKALQGFVDGFVRWVAPNDG